MPDLGEAKVQESSSDFGLPKGGRHPADDYNVYADISDSFLRKNQIDIEAFNNRGSIGFRDPVGDCRVQVSRCHSGKAVGLVVRGKKGGRSSILPEKPLNPPPAEKWVDLIDRVADAGFYSAFEPNPEIKPSHLNSIREICDPLYKLLFPGDGPRKGLLVVAGATASAKTQIANGLIHMYLAKRMDEWWRGQVIRKPHLVTFEDPIETQLIEWERVKAHTMGSESSGWTGSTQWCNWWRFPDYTPREKLIDVKHLKLAVTDALRQTPTIFYSAETRSHEDWPSLFKLAESHLVVTTTHASSIVATFNSLLAGLKFRTPTQRSEFASVLLGVVHLRPDETESTPALTFNLPSLWRRTPYATKAFAAEGMSSLVPIYVDDLEKAGTQEFYYLGRQTFAKLLTDTALVDATKITFQRFNKLDTDCANLNQLTKPAEPPQRNVNVLVLREDILDKAVDLDLRAE